MTASSVTSFTSELRYDRDINFILSNATSNVASDNVKLYTDRFSPRFVDSSASSPFSSSEFSSPTPHLPESGLVNIFENNFSYLANCKNILGFEIYGMGFKLVRPLLFKQNVSYTFAVNLVSIGVGVEVGNGSSQQAILILDMRRAYGGDENWTYWDHDKMVNMRTESFYHFKKPFYNSLQINTQPGASWDITITSLDEKRNSPMIYMHDMYFWCRAMFATDRAKDVFPR